MRTNDIYRTIDERLIEKDFWGLSLEEKKQQIVQELRNYTLEKLGTCEAVLPDDKDLDIVELLQLLANKIPVEQHPTTLNHFIHYILNVSSSLQGWAIVWMEEKEEELIEVPCVKFDENNRWTHLLTHQKTDYVKAFHFVLDVFQNHFLTDTRPKEKRLSNYEG